MVDIESRSYVPSLTRLRYGHHHHKWHYMGALYSEDVNSIIECYGPSRPMRESLVIWERWQGRWPSFTKLGQGSAVNDLQEHLPLHVQRVSNMSWLLELCKTLLNYERIYITWMRVPVVTSRTLIRASSPVTQTSGWAVSGCLVQIKLFSFLRSPSAYRWQIST